LLFPAAPVFAAPKYNVLLVSIDTLRSDHLGCYGSAAKTPNIDAFAANSVLFETAISQVPLTLPSHCTILTGLYPDQHGVLNNEAFVLPTSVTTLAQVFKQNGYSTGAVVGSFSLDSSFGINHGFDFYEDNLGQDHDPDKNRYLERRAQTVWSLGREWLGKQKGPWFCLLHFFDPHTGYNPPQPYPQTYDGEIAYVDKIMGDVLAYFNLSNTIVVLLSDHGESLGEHGESSHGVFLYDATLKVPLMMRVPGLQPHRVKSQVRLVDVAPTIAALAGLQHLPQFSGENLVPLLNGSEKPLLAFSETFYTNLLMGWSPLRSVRSETTKWIDAPQAELYDLLHDPSEQTNLFNSKPVPRNFHTEMDKHGKTASTQAAHTVDPETREKLASLGYVTGSSSSAPAGGMDPKAGIHVWDDIQDAVALAQKGKLEPSKELFLSALKEQPDNVIAQKFLANVLRKMGDNSQAVVYLKQAMQSPLHRDETQLDLGRTYFELQDYASALEQASALLQANPENVGPLQLTAYSYERQKKPADALPFWQRASNKRPEDADNIAGLARVSAALQHDTEALQAYSRLAKLRPLAEEEALQAGGVCLTDHKLDEAERYFRAALSGGPADPARAYKGLALIEAVRQNWNQSMTYFLKAGDCKSASLLSQKPISTNVLELYHKQCP
jgi:arylsulfatase A-like enzyme/Flp pilus assembly protein TadD